MKKSVVVSIVTVAVIAIGVFFFLNGNKQVSTITVGGTFPLTGEVASYGIKAKNGIQLKIDEVNQSGGINGQEIVVDFQDDRNSVKDAVNIFNSFATIKKHPIVFGSAGSTVSEALAPISLKEGIILISPVSGSTKLSSPEWKYFFRTIPSDASQAEKLVDWILSDSIKNIAVVYTNNSWGKPLSETVIKRFKEAGGNVVFEEGTKEGITDFRTTIQKLKQTSFDAIVSPTYPKEGGLFVKQLKETGVKTRLFGGDNWGAPEFLEIAQNAAEGVCFTFPSDSDSPLWDEFVNNYSLKYNEQPDIIAAYAYDAATAIVDALTYAKDYTADGIRNQLLKVNFEGVSGHISFKDNGDVTQEGYGKRTVENGVVKSLK
jgi:branched-chain amino acid transport system substrate-binding protein